MSEFKYLDLDVAAWVADTHHLTRAARGLYMDMIIRCWLSPGCKLPNNIDLLAIHLSCSKKEIPVLCEIVREFWMADKKGKWLHQKRLGKEWKASAKRKLNSQSLAKARWDKEKNGSRNASTSTSTYSTPFYSPSKGNRKKPMAHSRRQKRSNFDEAVEIIRRQDRASDQGSKGDLGFLPPGRKYDS